MSNIIDSLLFPQGEKYCFQSTLSSEAFLSLLSERLILNTPTALVSKEDRHSLNKYPATLRGTNFEIKMPYRQQRKGISTSVLVGEVEPTDTGCIVLVRTHFNNAYRICQYVVYVLFSSVALILNLYSLALHRFSSGHAYGMDLTLVALFAVWIGHARLMFLIDKPHRDAVVQWIEHLASAKER